MKIQLPKDPEAKRCVLIVIENHIGVILPLVTEGGFEYAPVVPYKDRYLTALIKLWLGEHVGTPINKGCGAMKVIEDALSWSDSEVEKFMKEWEEGKHQLTQEDQAALDRSREKLMERIHRTLKGPQ